MPPDEAGSSFVHGASSRTRLGGRAVSGAISRIVWKRVRSTKFWASENRAAEKKTVIHCAGCSARRYVA